MLLHRYKHIAHGCKDCSADDAALVEQAIDL